MHLSDEYPIKYEGDRLPPPIVADLNGDGKKEVLIATHDAKIHVLFLNFSIFFFSVSFHSFSLFRGYLAFMCCGFLKLCVEFVFVVFISGFGTPQ